MTAGAPGAAPDDGAGQRAYDIPLGRLLSVAPGLPTTDMARTVEHYQRLGFTFSAPGSAAELAEAGFAIGERNGVALHFAAAAAEEGRTPAYQASLPSVGTAPSRDGPGAPPIGALLPVPRRWHLQAQTSTSRVLHGPLQHCPRDWH
jgi:hypothetical protein